MLHHSPLLKKNSVNVFSKSCDFGFLNSVTGIVPFPALSWDVFSGVHGCMGVFSPRSLKRLVSLNQDLGVSKNRGTPKWMVHNGKPYQNSMDLGVPICWKVHGSK